MMKAAYGLGAVEFFFESYIPKFVKFLICAFAAAFVGVVVYIKPRIFAAFLLAHSLSKSAFIAICLHTAGRIY